MNFLLLQTLLLLSYATGFIAVPPNKKLSKRNFKSFGQEISFPKPQSHRFTSKIRLLSTNEDIDEEEEDPDDILAEENIKSDEDAEEEGEVYIGDDGEGRKMSRKYVNFPLDDGTQPATEYTGPEWKKRLENIYLVMCFDKKDESFENLRLPNMIEHVVWARRSARIPKAPSRVIFSRSMLSEDLSYTIGNLMGIAAESLEECKFLLKSEPYSRAGLFESVVIYSWPKLDDLELTIPFLGYPFALIAKDKPDSLSLRKSNRESHLKYLRGLDRVEGAAPLIQLEGDNKGNPCGSTVFFTAESFEEAQSIANNDPYFKAGLFESVNLYTFCDIDVEGTSQCQPLVEDPVRDRLEKEGLTYDADYPVEYEEVEALNIGQE